MLLPSLRLRRTMMMWINPCSKSLVLRLSQRQRRTTMISINLFMTGGAIATDMTLLTLLFVTRTGRRLASNSPRTCFKMNRTGRRLALSYARRGVLNLSVGSATYLRQVLRVPVASASLATIAS